MAVSAMLKAVAEEQIGSADPELLQRPRAYASAITGFGTPQLAPGRISQNDTHRKEVDNGLIWKSLISDHRPAAVGDRFGRERPDSAIR